METITYNFITFYYLVHLPNHPSTDMSNPHGGEELSTCTDVSNSYTIVEEILARTIIQ